MGAKHKFVFFSEPTFFDWDWRAIETGIGGSETSHIELARRLHQRGHEVVNYAPVPPAPRSDMAAVDEIGLVWRRSEDARYPTGAVNWNESGTWVIYRAPNAADHFGSLEEQAAKRQRLWLICQDVEYPTFTKDRAAKFAGVIALSEAHGRYLQNRFGYPNIGLSSNGIASGRMQAIIKAERLARHPHRLIYSSSPDRGLIELLSIFRRVREQVVDAELHVFYGFNNINIAIARWVEKTGDESRHPWRDAKESILKECKQPGVVWHGRVGQSELWRQFLQTAIWCYPTWFAETSCISSMEAQALGAIPITRPYWPLKENVQHGVFIEGDPNDPLTLARYAQEIIALMKDQPRQEAIRAEMMPWALEYFDWEIVADQLEEWAAESPPAAAMVSGEIPERAAGACLPHETAAAVSQFDFQRRHAVGRILNVGCDTDPAGLGQLPGAVNVDLVRRNPVSGAVTRPDVLSDARLLAFSRQFDTVVLGDILEHFTQKDQIRALRQARECLRNGGRIVITCPDDRRSLEDQLRASGEPSANGAEKYAEGVSAFHKPFERAALEKVIAKAGLHIVLYEQYQTLWYVGHGVVAEAAYAE